MSPSHTNKKGVRYRYYVSAPVVQGRKAEAGSICRIPAVEIETLVLDVTGAHLTANNADTDLASKAIERVSINKGQIAISLKKATFASKDGDQELDEERPEVITIAWTPQPHRRHREIILPENPQNGIRPIRTGERHNLLFAIRQARSWLNDLIAGRCKDLAALAERENKSERSIRMTLSLAFLDPAIVKAALAGRLPRGYGLTRLTNLPLYWPDQWRALALPKPGQKIELSWEAIFPE